MKVKNEFSPRDMALALEELQKVWTYEKFPYYDVTLTDEDIETIDKQTVSYGINLGTLRKIFTESA